MKSRSKLLNCWRVEISQVKSAAVALWRLYPKRINDREAMVTSSPSCRHGKRECLKLCGTTTQFYNRPSSLGHHIEHLLTFSECTGPSETQIAYELLCRARSVHGAPHCYQSMARYDRPIALLLATCCHWVVARYFGMGNKREVAGRWA
jgi:hypothetical protein